MTPSQLHVLQYLYYAFLHRVHFQLTMALILLATFATTPNVAMAQEQNISGMFVLDRNASTDIGTVIDEAVARIGSALRPTERAKLRRTNTPYPRIVMAITKKEVSIQYGTEPTIVCPLNGLLKWTAADGDKYDVRTEWRGGQLVQTFNNQKEGSRTNTFTISPDGRTISMFVVVQAKRLPEPMLYKLVFSRAS